MTKHEDFIIDTMVSPRTLYIFDQADPDNGIDTPWRDWESAAGEFGQPWISLLDETETANALVGVADDRANILLSNGAEKIGVYFMQAPIPLADIPDDLGIEVPLPDGEWSAEWRDHETLYAVENGLITAAAETDPDAGGDAIEPDDGPADDETGEVQADDAVYIKAAEIIGTETIGFNDALVRPVEILIGSMFGAGNKRNTLDGAWKGVKMPLKDLIVGFDQTADAPEFGLSRHTPSKTKEGPCMVLGSSIDGARKAKAMKTMHFLGLDIDSGAKLADVLNKIKKLGVFCLVHTSYNHGRCGLQLKRDVVLQKLQIKTDPTLEQIQTYLREFDKNRYEESFIADVTITNAKVQVKEGVVIELDTPPLDKFRLIFPLVRPVEIIELAETHQAALDIWEDAVTGLAHKVLGVHFDTSCTDPSRLFFTPRHPKSSDNWASYVIMGDPLDFDAVPRVKKAQYTKNRDLNAFVMADDTDGPQKQKTIILPSGATVNDWHSKSGKSRFMLADLLETYCQDKIRVAGGERSGHVHTECPFEHEHTSEGGTGTMAINALDNSSGYWTWFCHHDACQSRHKTELLGEAVIQGWFDEELLVSDEFLMPPADDEIDEDVEDARIERVQNPTEEPKGPKPANELIEGLFKDKDGGDLVPSEKDIRRLYKRLHKRGVDAVERTAINKEFKTRVGLDLNTLKGFWRDLDREKRDDDDAAANKVAPNVNEADFDVMVEYALNRIDKANGEEPRLFHYMERLAEVRDDQNSDARIHMLDRDGFANFLNRVSRYQSKVTEKKTRHVAAPESVVRHVYAGSYQAYPPLRGLVTSPTFSATGKVILEQGYHHESALYYQPNHSLVVPELSVVPTENEVKEAKRLLIEEVFADFPLGGRTRDQIVSECLEGAGIPAVANLAAFTLLPFCREMIDGPTPGHLVVKPTPGTGASLLTECVSIISTGFVTPSMAMPTNKDEMAKTLTSVLANGQNIVFFDNINDKVDSAELASALTAKFYSARLLGKSQTVETEVRCAWILTGNNVQLSGELVRRLIMIDLDARCAAPELRTGFKHANLRGWVEKNRGTLVWACLTIIQNWVAKGMPDGGNSVLASYETWSRVIGGVLECADIGGFLGNRKELEAQSNAENADDLITLLEDWWENVGSSPIPIDDPNNKVTSVLSIATASQVDLPVRRVRNADGEQVFSKQGLGIYLTQYKNRVFELIDGTPVMIKRGSRTRIGYSWGLVKTTQNEGTSE